MLPREGEAAEFSRVGVQFHAEGQQAGRVGPPNQEAQTFQAGHGHRNERRPPGVGRFPSDVGRSSRPGDGAAGENINPKFVLKRNKKPIPAKRLAIPLASNG